MDAITSPISVVAIIVLAWIGALTYFSSAALRKRAVQFEAALRAVQEKEPALAGMVIEEIADPDWIERPGGVAICFFTVVGLDGGRPNRVRMSANVFMYNGEYIVRNVERDAPAPIRRAS